MTVRRRPRLIAALVSAAVAAGALAGPVAGDTTRADAPAPAPAATLPHGSDEPTRRVSALAPPAQRVLIVSDSVGLGAAGALPGAFPPGWDVHVAGTPGRFVEQLQAAHVDPLVAAGSSVLGDHAVVAAGYNYPYWDPDRFDRSIDSIVRRLTEAGVDNVHWVTLREVKPQYVSTSAWQQVQPYFWYFPAVNDHLERALERHPNLSLVDWAGAADRPDVTYDAIHLNSTGARVFSRLIVDGVLAAANRPVDGSTTRVATPPATSGAMALNLTATGTRTNGYFTAYPCDGQRPASSNLNHGRTDTVAAAAIVPLGPSGEICVYSHRSAHVVADSFGTFGPDAGLTSTTATRLLDTRERPGRRAQAPFETLRVDVVGRRPAADVGTAALNVTATGASANGHVTAHACDRPKPNTSNLNFGPGRSTPNLIMVEPDDTGHVCLTPSAGTHLVVDLLATFSQSGTIAVGTTRRVLDTRRVPGVPVDGQVVRFRAPRPDGVDSDVGGAVIANLTIASPRARGYATVYPCRRGRTGTSNINFAADRNAANLFVVMPDDARELCVYTHRAAEVVVDVIGLTGSGFTPTAPLRLTDTRRD